LGMVGVDAEGRSFQLDERIEFLEVQQARDSAVLHRQQQLDEATHAGRRARVADVRLRAADDAVAALRGEAAEGAGQGVGFERPLGESISISSRLICVFWFMQAFAPPASATSVSPLRRLSQAR